MTSRKATFWPRSTRSFTRRSSIRRSPRRRRTKPSSQIDLDRYERLAATAAINKQQADTQRALVAQNTALVQADQAAIDNAQAMLGYTTITAPLDGRTGIRMVDEGNYVRSADTNSAVVVITQIRPISVLFNLPQQDLPQLNAAAADRKSVV